MDCRVVQTCSEEANVGRKGGRSSGLTSPRTLWQGWGWMSLGGWTGCLMGLGQLQPQDGQHPVQVPTGLSAHTGGPWNGLAL